MTQPAWTHPTAELALLGLLLHDRALVDRDDVTDALVADPHVAPAWRQLAATARRGLVVDAVSAVEVLRSAGIDMAATIVADAMLAAAPTPGAVLPTLHAFARRRTLRDAGRALLTMAEHPEDAERGSVEDVVARLTGLDAPTQEHDQPVYPIVAGAYLERTFARESGSLPGHSTGFAELDRLSGGLIPGDLTVLAARPSVGKSALAQQLALTIADGGKQVGVVSPEMSRWQLMERVVAARAHVPTPSLRNAYLTPRQREAVIEAGAALPPIWLCDDAVITVPQIAAMARRHHARRTLDLLVLDHLGFLADAAQRNESATVRVGRLTKGLKAIGREIGCAVLVLSQLNRKSETEAGMREPNLSDLRDSGEIEQDADAVWFIHRADRQAPEATVVVAKNRQGPLGSVALHFDGPTTTFRTREAA